MGGSPGTSSTKIRPPSLPPSPEAPVKTIARLASKQRNASAAWTCRHPQTESKSRSKRAELTSQIPLAAPGPNELLHFFNESPDLLCIAGLDGRFRRLNPAWEASLGWSAEELLSQPFLDFVHPEDRPATRGVMARLDAGNPTVHFENRYRCQDGTLKWLQWTAGVLPGRGEVYSIARDITRQKRLELEIIGALDRERERLGRDLHDGLCQDLAGIAALASTLARKLAATATAESAAAREIAKLLGQSIRNARDLARGLDPLNLHEIGLAASLADFCSNTTELFGIPCGFKCEPAPREVAADHLIHLYRIAQEAVSNAIAHGRAGRIDVSLVFRGDQGVLTIADDGVGIPDELERHPGIGLHTMAYRAMQIGASFHLGRRSPRGTVATCLFPMPRED